MNNQKTYRPFVKGTPANNLNRRFIGTRTEVIAPGVVVHWATPKADRKREDETKREKEFFHDFGPRYTKRHPGPQARG